jgi:putative ABC transport system permease protein
VESTGSSARPATWSPGSVILVAISGIIIGLIIYTFTLDKVKEIAMLKLLGAQGIRIYRMIVEQAVLMGTLGTLLGGVLERASEQYFPRRVIATTGDVGQMLVVIIIVATLASLLAIRRAMAVEARSVLGT